MRDRSAVGLSQRLVSQADTHDNMDALASDISVGSGETLATLAELMLVPEGDRAAFAKRLQDNFGAIYSSPSVTHTEVIDHLAKVVDAA